MTTSYDAFGNGCAGGGGGGVTAAAAAAAVVVVGAAGVDCSSFAFTPIADGIFRLAVQHGSSDLGIVRGGMSGTRAITAATRSLSVSTASGSISGV